MWLRGVKGWGLGPGTPWLLSGPFLLVVGCAGEAATPRQLVLPMVDSLCGKLILSRPPVFIVKTTFVGRLGAFQSRLEGCESRPSGITGRENLRA